MVKLFTLRYLRMLKNNWLASRTLPSLLDLLEVNKSMSAYFSSHINYEVFTVPKKNGSARLIENPDDLLKSVQRSINNYLQAVYYFYKHPSSYGFCTTVKNDKYPSNIYTHALAHRGCRYLMNVDLKDFFYSITVSRITDLFRESPFIHDEESIQWLCRMVTFNGRLPTGSPASPVISNLAATRFDEAMNALALRHGCCYTRYVDDMSFSSSTLYSPTLKEEVLQLIDEYDFIVNEKKIKEFDKDEPKIITGLRVGDTVSLSGEYWKKVDILVSQVVALRYLLNNRPGSAIHNRVSELEMQLNGYLAFAQMMGPAEKERVVQIEHRLDNIEDEIETFESLSWNDIPYHF